MPVRSGVGGFGGGLFFCWNVSARTAASLQYVLAVVRVSSSAIGPWIVLAAGGVSAGLAAPVALLVVPGSLGARRRTVSMRAPAAGCVATGRRRRRNRPLPALQAR